LERTLTFSLHFFASHSSHCAAANGSSLGLRIGRLALTVGWVAACLAVQAADTKNLRIGLIGPFTGPSADFGIPLRNGAELAVDEINAAGGYLGQRLELVIKDDAGDPGTGLRASESLISEKVIAAVGFCNTGVAMKSLPVFQASQTALIVPCSTGSPVTAQYPTAQSYIFRLAPRDAIQAPFVVEDLLKRGWNRVAVFADTTPYGSAGLNDVTAALAKHQLKPAYIARFGLGVQDLTKDLKAARAAGANVIFSYTVGPENAVIAQGRADLGWKVTQVGAWALSFPFFIDGAGAAAEGSLMSQTFIAEPSNERKLSFLNAYKRKYGTDKITVPMAAAQAYDSVYILAHAILSVRESALTGPVIKQALENLERPYYGVIATHSRPFTPDDHEAISPNMLVMGTVKNGAVTFAYPSDRTRSLVVQRKK
jgi:branched-chain amino acid transport system substrate-binding protein